MRLLLLFSAALLSGCLPLGLGGVVGGEALSFVDVTYAEIREVDVATSTPVHPIDVFLMPMDDPCARFEPLVNELTALREELDFGMSAEEYCDTWEGTFEEHLGHIDGFWIGWARLNARPRPDNTTPRTTYDFLEEESAATPDGPTFDIDLLWYPPTTFDACATEFAGETFYAPTAYTATGGTTTVTAYAEDDSITARFEADVEDADENPTQGRASAEFCPAALDWTIEFGLGQARR